MPDLRSPAVIAVLFGLLLGAVLGGLAARKLIRHIAFKGWAPKVVTRASVAVMLVSALPSCLFGFVVGGNLGVSLSALALNTAVSEFVGMAFGIAFVFSICLAASGAIGGGMGAALMVLSRDRNSASASRVEGAVRVGSARVPS